MLDVWYKIWCRHTPRDDIIGPQPMGKRQHLARPILQSHHTATQLLSGGHLCQADPAAQLIITKVKIDTVGVSLADDVLYGA